MNIDRKNVSLAKVVEKKITSIKERFFLRLKHSFLKTKESIGLGFMDFFRGKKIDDNLFEELEARLLMSDIGVKTTGEIINHLIENMNRKELKDAEMLYSFLQRKMKDILKKVEIPLNIEERSPFLILIIGVNGVGKTTTIGKLAYQFKKQGKSVMLAAGDTSRAAAVEQLQIWGDRNNTPVISHSIGSDSASVIFHAAQIAREKDVDILIADTSGRLQNRCCSMKELKKIVHAIKKLDTTAPHEIMLVIDACTGQNAITQARLFHEAVGLTGITLTKLDGTAKGGVIFSIANECKIPIRYVGIGESIEDLHLFNVDDFINVLFK